MIELDKGDIKEVVNMSESKEIKLGKSKYSLTSDDDFDYLVKTSNGIKITLKFTKDREIGKKGMEGIETFFSSL